MTRNIEKHEKWYMHTVGPWRWQDTWKSGKWEIPQLGREIWRENLKKLEKEKCPLYDMEYGRKTEKYGKWETSTWRHDKWRNHWKMWKMRMHSVGPGIWQENWKSGKWE